MVILLFSHLLYAVIASADGDLVEERRRFRRWFLIAVVALVLLITVVEVTGGDKELYAPLAALHAATFVLLSMVFLLWSARITAEIWIRRDDVTVAINTHSPADIALAAKVKSAMENELWREEKLTIGVLANRLDTQEHRLRRSINRVMGYRNFAAFINGYRIEAAKRELADPDKAEKAILNIAYDVGFASIGPFNRAFRLATGVSPSEYRRIAIEGELTR
jgi:AraC-like DNA-binding protein